MKWSLFALRLAFCIVSEHISLVLVQRKSQGTPERQIKDKSVKLSLNPKSHWLSLEPVTSWSELNYRFPIPKRTVINSSEFVMLMVVRVVLSDNQASDLTQIVHFAHCKDHQPMRRFAFSGYRKVTWSMAESLSLEILELNVRTKLFAQEATWSWHSKMFSKRFHHFEYPKSCTKNRNAKMPNRAQSKRGNPI